MDVFRWIGARDFTPGTPVDLRWAWVTVGLSAVVVCGYAVIAFNRYFQSKLDRRTEARAASMRLINIFACCCVCGVVFYATDMAWRLWRLYDLVLLCVALYAWSFVVRTRALSLVDARLARVEELERTAEQQKALVAQKEMQAKQKAFFLNALSHDLRAPLNIVALNAHLLKTAAREEAELESAKLIIENAVTAGDLVAKALELAKADAEDQNMLERVPVPDVIHQVVRRFAPIAEQKGLFLRLAEVDDVELLTDRMKLERIVSNLVDNAIKFTDRGGVTIEAKALEGSAVVRVTDTGMGIAPDIAPHLFDEFYQGPGHADGGRKGFGMGLTICRFLARQLGGDVRLARTGPGGSGFDLVISGTGPGGIARADLSARVGMTYP
jgi:signal transduction histidine kinase